MSGPYDPGSNTAILDAITRSLINAENMLNALPTMPNPELVVAVAALLDAVNALAVLVRPFVAEA